MPLILDAVDLQNIAAARIVGGKVWYNPDLEYLRTKIKESFINQDIAKCCYCSRLFTGEFKMVIDVEHVLPQSLYDDLMFNPLNLNIACKRCNMNIKKAKIDFIQDLALMGTDYFNTVHYKIIHPNLDNYMDHIIIKQNRYGNFVIVKYVVKNNSKGQYTYDYFQLRNLEIDNINQAQGIKAGTNLSSKVNDYLRIKLLKLLNSL